MSSIPVESTSEAWFYIYSLWDIRQSGVCHAL